jgi:hypothetical protein
MRSKLIYSAENCIQDEFLLASLAMKAMRRLGSSASGRTEDRVNQAFSIIAQEGSVGRDPVAAEPGISPVSPEGFERKGGVEPPISADGTVGAGTPPSSLA